MSIRSNLTTRLHLLRVALTEPRIWPGLCSIVKAQGFDQRDIRGNVNPLGFARQFPPFRGLPALDFAGRLGDREDFALTKPHYWSAEPSVGAFLGELALYMGAKTVVELGCYVGWTSAHLALGLAETGGKLWCVDAERRFLDAARANLTRIGLADGVQFVEGLSLAPEVTKALPQKIDLLFIDTSHAYQVTVDEIATYLPRLAPGGMIALHDSISKSAVRQALLDQTSAVFSTLTFATEYGNGVTVLFAPQSQPDAAAA